MAINTENKKRIKPPRIRLTDSILQHLRDKTDGMTVSALCRRSGLPYGLVYNVVHKRVATISARHYRMLFNEPTPAQEPDRVDGTRFRNMVRLWLFLNNAVTKTDLYQELCGHRNNRKVDYRIFSEKIDTVEAGLERAMEMKFENSGLDPATLDKWLAESEKLGGKERVDYQTIRPVLQYIQNTLGVHPTSLLNQFSDRYERGDLKTVSQKVYDRAAAFRVRAENAVAGGDRLEIERIKEEIYGQKRGYTLYAEIVEPLRFLQRYAKKSPKRYLGRGTYMYEKGGCKRIPTWRAEMILKDCDQFIQSRMDLPLAVLPRLFQRQWAHRLQAVMVSRAADMLSKVDGIMLEKKILTPAQAKDKYKAFDRFTQFDRASTTLGMQKAAFDLMVAKNCEIFREVGKYSRRWYLSDLYLKELSENPNFKLITAKYERMANSMKGRSPSNQCMPPNLA